MILTAETLGWLLRTGQNATESLRPPFQGGTAQRYSDTLVRSTKSMSRQTSLQRTEQKNSECHHPFLIVKIRLATHAGSDGKFTIEKSAFQRRRSPHA